MFSDFDLKNLEPKERAYRISENTNDRNQGRLIFEVKPTGNKYFYFQTFKNGKRSLSKIGSYFRTDPVNGMTLKQARKEQKERSEELSLIDPEIDYKTHLKKKELDKRRKKRQEAQHGSFSMLLFCYVAMMRLEGKTSWDHVRKDLNRYVFKPHNHLLDVKANKITEEDIMVVLSSMISKGVTTKTNRVRSYLHTAFAIGAKYERDPLLRAKSQVTFDLKHNPVALIPRQKTYERVGERFLSDDEIRLVWKTIESEIGIIPAKAIKFALSTGLRAGHELLSLKWEYYDEKQQLFDIPNTKNKKPFILPVNELAIQILEDLKPISHEGVYIFVSSKKRAKAGANYRSDSMGAAVANYCQYAQVEKFVPRDIRRTVKTHMGKAGIDKPIRDRLQNHVLTDVSSKHYDRYDYLEEKRRAVKIWCTYLDGIINPKDNVVLLKKKD